MKKLLLFLAFVVVVTALRDVVGYFGPMAEAYRSYRDQATALALDRGKTRSFRNIDGHIVDVSYHLETAEPIGDDEVHLTVREAIQFQKASEMRPFGNRRVAVTRQYVSMSRVDGRWVVSHIEEDATEITELNELDLGDE
ncbi:MAG: hypothetical protein BMS9Abin37_3049 [Acidobacteriota bacterium]|nr:MAG: hypothetical protein BMS9Abin37_3049 [Acidobacteriota bacterium]